MSANIVPFPSQPIPQGRQKNWISGGWEVQPVQLSLDFTFNERIEVQEGVSIVLTENGSQLLVSGFGLFVGLKSERVSVRLKRRTVIEVPFHDLELVVVASRGVSLSSDLVHELAQRGIRLSFLGRGGSPAAMLHSPMMTATVATRRAQLAADDNGAGIELARWFVYGKLRNQEKLLRYFAKHLKKSWPRRYQRVEERASRIRGHRNEVKRKQFAALDEARSVLMGIEGSAGRHYWQGVGDLLNDRADFPGRRHRGAQDPVNSAVNYGYGVLYFKVWNAVLNAGLEPFAGFLHVDRSGKPSLVLDLIEEFRQPIVDRAVLSAISKGTQPRLQADGLLDSDTRRWIAAKVFERLTTVEHYRGKRCQLRSIIQMQARRVAGFVRGTARYRPFTFRW